MNFYLELLFEALGAHTVCLSPLSSSVVLSEASYALQLSQLRARDLKLGRQYWNKPRPARLLRRRRRRAVTSPYTPGAGRGRGHRAVRARKPRAIPEARPREAAGRSFSQRWRGEACSGMAWRVCAGDRTQSQATEKCWFGCFLKRWPMPQVHCTLSPSLLEKCWTQEWLCLFLLQFTYRAPEPLARCLRS